MTSKEPAVRESFVQSFLGNLRFPQLFLVLLALLAADFFLLDPIPFVDEAMLLVLTLMAGALKKKVTEVSTGSVGVEKEPEKNITPTE